MNSWNIVWHYRDLRVADNPALYEAAKGNVLPIYIHSPKEEGEWPSGAASNWWLHSSLQDLQKQYKALGSQLVIRKGEAFPVLKKLFSKISVSGIYWNLRYEPELRERDGKLLLQLQQMGIEVYCFEGNYLISPQKLLNKSGKPYSVFTPFSKTVMQTRNWREPLPVPKLVGVKNIESDSVESLELLPKLDWADGFLKEWRPGRGGAVEKLKAFRLVIEKYQEDRDTPYLLGTSRLSPHLNFGEISPHEIWKIIEKRTENGFPFLRQLLWREFGNYFIYHWKSVTDVSWKQNFENFPWEENQEHLKAWQKGETGYPIVDAGMRELWKTGWMHNRVRMIVASFLIKDLFIHWKEGARWFWDTLLDANLANNTLGWQWVAGSGPDAAPYFRIFNPILQGKKFDPDGEYIKKWVPELRKVPSKWVHTPWEFPNEVKGYSLPIVDHAEARKKALDSYQKIK